MVRAKQEYFRISFSLNFLIPLSIFAFCNSSMSDITNSKRYSSDVIGGVDPVLIASNICSDNKHNDYEEAFSEEPHPRREKLTTKLMWKHLGYGFTLRRWRRRKSMHSVIYTWGMFNTQKITAQVCSSSTWRDTMRTCTNIIEKCMDVENVWKSYMRRLWYSLAPVICRHTK